MAARIDFKHVRAHADIGRVLQHYNIELTPDGSKPHQRKCLCPFHDDKKPSLKVNLEKGIYNCFVCGAKGNVLDFIMAHESLAIRPAAMRLAEICEITLTSDEDEATTKSSKSRRRSSESRPPATPDTPAEPADELDSEQENLPLSFELKLTQDDELTEWLESHGITSATAEAFGLGRASKKSKTIPERLAIPIHNASGKLVAYCGRYIGDDKADDVPKYKLPAGFLKERELFNLHRLPDTLEHVFIFESYLSVMRHHEHVPCVSPFGRDLSAHQLELLEARSCRRFVVIFDGDEPGRAGAQAVAGRLATIGWSRICNLPDGVKPHHLDWDELKSLFQ